MVYRKTLLKLSLTLFASLVPRTTSGININNKAMNGNRRYISPEHRNKIIYHFRRLERGMEAGAYTTKETARCEST